VRWTDKGVRFSQHLVRQVVPRTPISTIYSIRDRRARAVRLTALCKEGELTCQYQYFPAHGVSGVGIGARPGMMWRGFGPRHGGDASQGSIQILRSTGQNTFYQTSIDRDSGRVTLSCPQMPQMGEAKEIRISSIVRATAQVSFELHDLSMACRGSPPGPRRVGHANSFDSNSSNAANPVY
jgi:hypothetical protein